MQQTIVKSLINRGFNEFWYCAQENFDGLSRIVMKRIKKDYKNIYLCISVFIILISIQNQTTIFRRKPELIYPPEPANGLQKFAIERRNRYIAKNADAVVCYITDQSGGVYKAIKIAEKNNKEIINIAEFFSNNKYFSIVTFF